jgi:nucleoside-diphosphate-sugar epimerase
VKVQCSVCEKGAVASCSVVCMCVDPEEHPQKETYWGHVNPIGPRACYDEAKRVAETMCYAYSKQVYTTHWCLQCMYVQGK